MPQRVGLFFSPHGLAYPARFLYTVLRFCYRVILMKRFYICCILFVFSLFLTLPASASETASPLFSAEITEAPSKQGDAFTVLISPTQDDIAAFVLTVEYDSATVTQVKAELTGANSRDYTTFLSGDGTASFAYTAADGALPTTGGVLLHFRTDSDFFAEELALHFEITEAADSAAENLLSSPESHTVNITFPPLPSSECTLISLTPPAGTLIPDFDPDILNYTLEVPFEYTTLNFEAVPVEGASVRVNRKNLGSGGSTVEFTFTVTAADNSTKAVYTVAVTRLEKETVPEAEEESTASGSSGSKSSAASSSKGSSGSTPTSGPSEATSAPAESPSAENTAASSASNTDTTSPTIYIYPETGTNQTADRLVTAAIVLLSVCIGVGIACVVQARFVKSDDTDKESKSN